MYIVAEYLFLENFIINYIILYGTKTITRTKVKKRRIFLTGILAALYSFVFFFDSTLFLTRFYMKVIISLLIVKLAYNAKDLRLYLKQLTAFYLVSFVFGGATIGIYFFSNSYIDTILGNNSYIKGFPIKYLIFGISFGIIIVVNILDYYYEKVQKEDYILDVKISFNNREVDLRALIDTGNSLVEPLENQPVFIVEYEKVENLLPEDIREIFKEDREEDFISLEKMMRKYEGEIDIRLIPFKSVGKSNGILLGLIPDFISVLNKDKENLYTDLVIGIFNGKLSDDGQYSGLINKEILNRGNLYVNENKDKSTNISI